MVWPAGGALPQGDGSQASEDFWPALDIVYDDNPSLGPPAPTQDDAQNLVRQRPADA